MLKSNTKIKFMKKLLLLLFVLPIFITAQNLPTIYTDHPNNEIENYDEDEDWYAEEGSDYHDCIGNIEVKCINASSTLASQGSNNYSVSNMNDFNPRTAWVEGRSDYGIGESFEIRGRAYSDYTILNGYQKSIKSWKDNSRVKTFKVYADNVPVCYLKLGNNMSYQNFDFDFDFNVLRFEIAEVYKGNKWSDVAISGFYSVGCCFTQNTTILSELNETPIDEMNKGAEISFIDLKSDKILSTEVVRTAKVKHTTLLKIKTEKNEIELTPDHPLYIKGYGLSSLASVRLALQLDNFQNLINNIEVLIWNKATQKSEYTKVLDIDVLKGVFDTYTILKMKNGKTFIANGFITSVY